MGKLIWNQWARLIALTAAFFDIVGGIFGCFYRLDMYGSNTFIQSLVDPINILAVATIVLGLLVLLVEMRVRKIYGLRGFMYVLIGGFSVLDYQTVNPGLYLIIAGLMYTTAWFKGEGRPKDKEIATTTKRFQV